VAEKSLLPPGPGSIKKHLWIIKLPGLAAFPASINVYDLPAMNLPIFKVLATRRCPHKKNRRNHGGINQSIG
jgi:hypothetical protein